MPANTEFAKQNLLGRTQTAWARTGQRVGDELVATSPVDTGKMRDSTRAFPRAPRVFELVVATDYASFVREGTRPRRIEARSASVLRWEDAGGVRFARFVNHPGTRANSWYDDATAKRLEFFDEEMSKIP